MKTKKSFSKMIADTYDKNAAAFDAAYNGKSIDNKYIEWPAIKKSIRGIKKPKGKKLLDIGCGTGRHIEKYEKMGLKCTGIDISERMLEIARKRNPRVPLYRMPMEKLKFKKSTFDIVTSSLAFHYGNFHHIMRQINHVLKLNGTLIFSTSNPFDDARENIVIKGNKFSMIGKITYSKTNKIKIIGDYFSKEIGSAYWKSKGISIKWKHTTLEEMIDTLSKNGFIVTDFVEARPTSAAKKINPFRYEYTRKIPVIILFKAKKIASVK